MEKRPIDAYALAANIHKSQYDNPHTDIKVARNHHFEHDHFLKMVCLMPTIDVIEIVRCKDCKHGRPPRNDVAPEKYFKDDYVVCQCEDVVGDEPMIYKPAHFCSYGEIKER